MSLSLFSSLSYSLSQQQKQNRKKQKSYLKAIIGRIFFSLGDFFFSAALSQGDIFYLLPYIFEIGSHVSPAGLEPAV